MAQQPPLSKTSERAEQCRQSADTGQRIQRLAFDHAQHIRDRSELPRRLCAELADFGAARFARLAADDGDLSRHQRNARRCRNSCRTPIPIGAVNPCPACPAGFAYLTSNGNSTREAGTVPVAAKAAQRLHRDRCNTLSRNPSRRCRAGRPGSCRQPTRRRIQRSNAPRRVSRTARLPAPRNRHRAELARPARRTRALEFRSAPSV